MMDVMLTPEAAKQLDAARKALEAAKAAADAQVAEAEQIRRQAVLDAVDSGASQSEIASVLGVSQGRVAQIVKNRR